MTIAAATGTPGAEGAKPAEGTEQKTTLVDGKPAGEKPAGEKPAGEAKTEEKPAGEKPAGETAGKTSGDGAKTEGKDGKAAAEPKAPEKYALTMPEGGHVDAKDLATLETIARAQNLSNEEAQALLDSHAASVAAESERFLTETKADPEYGGDKLDKSIELATALLDKVRPKGTARGDALRSLLTKTGYGNHVEVIALLADLGKLMAEDGHVGGKGGGNEKKSTAEVLYGSDK